MQPFRIIFVFIEAVAAFFCHFTILIKRRYKSNGDTSLGHANSRLLVFYNWVFIWLFIMRRAWFLRRLGSLRPTWSQIIYFEDLLGLFLSKTRLFRIMLAWKLNHHICFLRGDTWRPHRNLRYIKQILSLRAWTCRFPLIYWIILRIKTYLLLSIEGALCS